MYGHDERSQWTSQRRVCIPEFFDRYFQLSLPAGQVSESTIQEIFSLKENRDALVGIFTQLQEQDVLVTTLVRLESERSLSTMRDPMPYLLALSDISDRIPDNKATVFSVSGQQLIRFAINRVLSNIPDLGRKIEIVTGLITDGNGVSLSSQLLWSVTEPKESSPYPHILDADLEPLKALWLRQVRKLAADGHLLEVSGLPPVLYGWLDWSDPKEAKDWVASLSQDPKKLLSFLHTHISRSTVQGIGSYHVRHRSWISWAKDLQRFMSQEDWRKAGDLLARSKDLSDEESQTLSLFQKAMNCWEKEIDDAQFNDAEGFTV
jgi:predicted KAP-like P-loop ATPase